MRSPVPAIHPVTGDVQLASPYTVPSPGFFADRAYGTVVKHALTSPATFLYEVPLSDRRAPVLGSLVAVVASDLPPSATVRNAVEGGSTVLTTDQNALCVVALQTMALSDVPSTSGILWVTASRVRGSVPAATGLRRTVC